MEHLFHPCGWGGCFESTLSSPASHFFSMEKQDLDFIVRLLSDDRKDYVNLLACPLQLKEKWPILHTSNFSRKMRT